MSRHEPVENLLTQLSKQQIRVWMDNGSIRCAGPAAALTSDVTDNIRSRKAEIIAFLANDKAPPPANATQIIARGNASPPLSFAQKRLWFIDRMLPDTALHHMSFAVDAYGTLDRPAFESALRNVIGRHAVFRSRIREAGGEPVQTVLADADFVVEFAGAAADDEGLQNLVDADTRRPFDLASEPPLRLTVVPVAAEHHVILLTLHHICVDGWSIEVLLRDLAAFYEAAINGHEPSMKPLSVEYGDFAAWQQDYLQGKTLERSLEFWRTYLADLPNTQMPTDFQRPAMRSNEGGLQRFEIAAPTVRRLREIAAAEGATLFATLFAAFNILIYRYTGQLDLVVGTPVANRRQQEVEDVIGLFVNPLPIRTRLQPSRGFIDNLRVLRDNLWDAQEHQDLPFERLVEDLKPERDPSLNPLFQLKFQLDTQARQNIRLPGLELARRPRQQAIAKLDLSLDLTETGDVILGNFEFDTALFRPETLKAMASHFGVLVAAIAANPAQAIAELPLLSARERQFHVEDWNGTAQAFDTDTCFHTLFEKRAAATPDAIAAVHANGADTETLTYDALNRRANRLAHLLRSRGVGPETVVGIALERGLDMVAAWLGVLKAGGAYLPLDPSYPAERLSYMLSDSGAALVVSHSSMSLPSNVKRIDLDVEPLDGMSDNNPVSSSRPDHLAYVIYTSGSTGRPKGVLVQHGGLTNLTEDKIRVCGVRLGDCVLQFFSFSFDASIPELVMSLGAGASLLLLSSDAIIPGPELARQITDNRVTHVTMTPSALLALPSGAYPDLRMILVGGEAPSPELISRWCSRRLFINAYGPTETTVNASMVACGNGEPLDATLWPAANKQLYVLDENLEILPVGVPGELHIGGVGLARGYHGRPALTAERFVPDPFGRSGVLYKSGDRACRLADGRIRVLGRLDDQVKIRGYRIEPGEIEAAILSHPEVASAAIAIRSAGSNDKRIFAYAVASTAYMTSPVEMRTWLSQRLPRFLVPAAFVWLDTLPLTVNGKLDISALPDPEISGTTSGRPPSGSTEHALCEAFRTVLGVTDVLASDDFFELGGHSLLATKLSAVAKEKFGLEVSVLDIFNAPSVEDLAARLDSRNAGKAHAAIRDILQDDIRLDRTIRPAMPITPVFPPRRVFLTGATGFLGTYLLRDLLRDPDREVWCLVRGEFVQNRLRDTFARSGLEHEAMMSRIHAISGDLSSPGLGLDASTYVNLATRMDAIVHNGAEVHHLHPYERLRAANVGGMVEALRLACAGRGRPFHHVSSLSALTPRENGEPIRESDGISGFAPPSGGYNVSKWVAEHLAEEARSGGLPVSIYRPGAVTGDSVSGAFNGADILCRLMQGYLRSAMAPEGDAPLEMLPVDYLTRAIVYLIDKPAALCGTYHMIHSMPASTSLIFDACKLEGLEMTRVGRDEWRDTVSRIIREEPDHPLYPLAGLIDRPAPEDHAVGTRTRSRSFDCTATRNALSDAPFTEPSLDAALFRTYLRAFVTAGALQTSIVDRQDP